LFPAFFERNARMVVLAVRALICARVARVVGGSGAGKIVLV
jgi:hypothetical protein